MLAAVIPNKHIIKGNFVWDLPDLEGSGAGMKAIGLVVNDWQLSGVWTASTGGIATGAGGAYNIGYSYTAGGGNVNITGSPDYGGRVRIVGDTGSGCSSDPLRQFNAAAFQGPLPNSDGLESPAGYLRGCFQSAFDLAIARNFRLGGSRVLQLRVEMFNAPNQAIVTARNATMNLASPTDPVTITNLPYDPATGAVVDSRSRPRGAGFGVATGVSGSAQRPGAGAILVLRGRLGTGSSAQRALAESWARPLALPCRRRPSRDRVACHRRFGADERMRARAGWLHRQTDQPAHRHDRHAACRSSRDLRRRERLDPAHRSPGS